MPCLNPIPNILALPQARGHSCTGPPVLALLEFVEEGLRCFGEVGVVILDGSALDRKNRSGAATGNPQRESCNVIWCRGVSVSSPRFTVGGAWSGDFGREEPPESVLDEGLQGSGAGHGVGIAQFGSRRCRGAPRALPPGVSQHRPKPSNRNRSPPLREDYAFKGSKPCFCGRQRRHKSEAQ